MTRHSFHFSTASVSLFIEGRPVEVLLVGSHAAKTHKSAGGCKSCSLLLYICASMCVVSWIVCAFMFR